jgi:hypothetical protein
LNRLRSIAVLSDVHYAGPTEQARGDDYEFRSITHPALRLFARSFRHFIWLRQPLRHGGLLDRFLADAAASDYVVANGDYSCDTKFVGVSDDASCESARECLGKLRAKFGEKFQATIGDHELGKLHLFGADSGLRLTSWRRTTGELGLRAFWQVELGHYVLMGITSTLVALPLFEQDMKPGEKAAWEKLRARHLEEIRGAFAALDPRQRVLLFCHDPSALPFLWRDDTVRGKVTQIEQTVIGHLHSNLVLWKARLLSGLPAVRFLGHNVHRMTTAVNEARCWKQFRIRLCPALAGIQLLNDGGWLSVELDLEAPVPAQFRFHPIRR